ncbi:Glycosyltransferase type 1 [Halomicronema hongdechloris C2206]|uniref:Glycosyltransferase type 1 n=1 Tax=Halomicronema hongdechloris C2206 TaxID=1641165 RepID=A0A1Z3HM21_9CYAN|nr:glycosyltransferase [Halomicronema hongdechloris]ASC71325.1 Glycosyltransferase type 1 [Halomicronema hongdechloris C2206]
MSNILIFSSLLLPPSQTFIKAQAEGLQQFTSHYVGCRRVDGLSLPAERTSVINPGTSSGKLKELLFKLTGRSRTLRDILRKIDPVLIHAQFGLSGALLLSSMRSLDIPLIVHYRGADATLDPEVVRFSSINHWIYYQRLDQLKQTTHLFLTVSHFIRKKLIEQGFPDDKIMTHYNGVDIQQFRADMNISREPVVLFVGRLTEKKGCQDLLKAMAQVQMAHPGVRLILIGDGPLREGLEKFAEKHLKQCRFLGVQSHATVKDWMNRARVLAAPSITSVQGDSEGLPNVVLEAQAMGLPVVSTFHAGIPEAVIHQQTGFLVEEHDSDNLGMYIAHLFQDDELWQSFSRQGRLHVETNFDRQRQIQLLETLYEETLEQYHGTTRSAVSL